MLLTPPAPIVVLGIINALTLSAWNTPADLRQRARSGQAAGKVKQMVRVESVAVAFMTGLLGPAVGVASGEAAASAGRSRASQPGCRPRS
jgi:hypothetical protein